LRLGHFRRRNLDRVTAVINLAIQFMTLLCGLAVNFLIPALFGLEQYGLFLRANLLVFLFHKLTDIANEPLISLLEANSIFPISMSICCLVLVAFSTIDLVYPIGSPLLLASMLLSSSVSLSMYALRKSSHILCYLVAFLVVFCGLLSVRGLGPYRLGITEILIATNLIPASVVGIALASSAGRGSCGNEQLHTMIRPLRGSLPSTVSLTLVFNLFTNVFPFLLSKTLAPGDLGLFRVMTSVVQSATSVFPLNVKSIFVAFATTREPQRLYSVIASVSLSYFALAGLVGCIISVSWPQLHPYMALVCSIPALYWAALSERFLLAIRQTSFVRSVNLGIALTALPVMFFVTTVREAVICYAFGFSAYALLLLLKAQRPPRPVVLFWVCCASIVVAAFFEQSPLVGGIYLVVCIAIALLINRTSLPDLRFLLESL
jgi:hypothetical protein